MPVKFSLDDFLRRSIQHHGDLYNYSKVVYTSIMGKVTITCPVHGEFNQVARYHMDGAGCPKCTGTRISDSKRVNFTLWLSSCRQVHGDTYKYRRSSYKGAYSLVDIKCPIHGIFQQRAYSHRAGHGCPKCAGESNARLQSYTQQSFISACKQVHSDKYSYMDTVYDGCYSPITVSCPAHGNFTIRAYYHLQGGQCPACLIPNKSTVESNLYEALLSLGIDVTSRSRSVLKNRELDIHFPDNKLAIEVNGLYWHSEEYIEPSYHLSKTLDCKKQGIQLLHFWDVEINQKMDLVVSMIKARLGSVKRLYARNLHVDLNITNSEGCKFLDRYHLQGADNASVYIGLRSKKTNKLACLMSFVRPRFNSNYQWEISRFATAIGITVVGGASRLLKAFEREYIPESLITYADLRYSQGNLYKQLGFNFSHTSKPNYFYVKSGIVVSRYQSQKHKLPKLLGDNFDPALSEVENMNINGWYRVFDCGNLVFTKSY